MGVEGNGAELKVEYSEWATFILTCEDCEWLGDVKGVTNAALACTQHLRWYLDEKLELHHPHFELL